MENTAEKLMPLRVRNGEWVRPPVKYSELLAEMARRGVNKSDLAEICSRSSGYVSQRFNLDKEWSIEDIRKIAAALEIPKAEWLHYFFEDEV